MTTRDDKEPAIITAHVCGTKLCHDGQPHDDKGEWRSEDGREWSVACSRCGRIAMHEDLLRLP